MRRYGSVLLIPLLCLCVLRVQAQQPAPNTDFSGLKRIGSTLKDRPLFMLAIEPDATLKTKQQALQEPEIKNTLRELREWLDKPLQLPLTLSVTGLAEDFPAVSSARQLARALLVQQYVQLANGNVREAIDTMRDALRLSYAVESHSTMGMLVGVAIERMAMSNLFPHIEQLSQPDCNALMKLAQDWSNTSKIIDFALLREQAVGIESLKTQQDTKRPEIQEAIEALKQMYSHAQAMNAQPYWERDALTFEAKGEALKVGEILVSSVRPLILRLLDNATRRTALARMLSCHAAIRRYKWENSKLPPSLETLAIKEMAVDPFTGKEFHYQQKGETFTLESAGAYERDDKGNQDRSSRTPFSLSGTARP